MADHVRIETLVIKLTFLRTCLQTGIRERREALKRAAGSWCGRADPAVASSSPTAM